jgi:hypothetical protein
MRRSGWFGVVAMFALWESFKGGARCAVDTAIEIDFCTSKSELPAKASPNQGQATDRNS